MALTTTQMAVSNLLTSMFNAAPGKEFLDLFTAQVEAGQTIDELAEQLAASGAFTGLYPTSQSDLQFSTAWVTALLGGQVTDASAVTFGIDYVTGLLTAGQSRADVIQSVSALLVSVDNADPVWGNASAQFENKLQAAQNYSETQTSTDFAVLQAAISSVTEDPTTVPDVVPVVVPTVPGETFTLTSGTDRGADFTGTANDDQFNAYLAQNAFAGGVSNSLSSADVLDGAEGTDSLYAELVPEFFGATGDNQIDVQPRTSNIEIVQLEARDSGSNDVNSNTTVTVDAKNMLDVDKIGSFMSDGDLVIENLTTQQSSGVNRNTEELTITMDHTDNFNSDGDASDLSVYLDEDYLLVGESTSASQANYWLLDENSVDYVAEPLLTIERTGVTLTIDGVAVTIKMTDAVAAAADDWVTFAAGLQTVIDAEVAAGQTVFEGLTVAVDVNNTDSTFNDAGVEVTIPAITITDAAGRVLVPTGFTSPAEVTPGFDIYGKFDNVAAVTAANPLSINVELNKVGREGEGGDLLIGGKELDSDGGAQNQGNGIGIFNIDVLGDATKLSNVGSINSTNNALTTVNIATGAAFVGGTTLASLTVRDAFNASNAVETVNANAFLGDLNIGQDTAALNVDTFTATGGGAVTYNASIDGTEKGVFTNTTGAGNDTVTVALDGDAVDTTGTSFAVNTNGGDDSVTVSMVTADAGVSFATMALLDNLDITTGAGADTVNVNGYGTFDITAGAGSDYVRINSVDNNGNATTGSWAFGNASGTDGFGVGFGVDGSAVFDNAETGRVLYNATLTLSFAGFEETVSVLTDVAGNFVASQLTINAAITAAIAANPELAKLLTITSGTGAQQLTITSNVGGDNSLAIAIYQPQLTTGAAAADGSTVSIAAGDTAALEAGLIATTTLDSDDLNTAALIVTATDAMDDFHGSVHQDGGSTEGLFSTANISHDVASAASATDTGTDILDNGVGTIYQEYDLGGSADSTTGNNFSNIDLGTGSNDLVVLHSRDGNVNTIEITETFGKVSVVNFHNEATNAVNDDGDVGVNALDFSKYLTNTEDLSATTTTESATPIATTVNIVLGYEAFDAVTAGASKTNTNLANANSVNVLRFVENATDSFASLTATNLITALNGSAAANDYGNLTFTTLNAGDANANFMGTTQNHIVMVENSLNEGEYKVFSLTSTVDATTGLVVSATDDFDTAATLLGTLDFGASVNLNVTDSAAFDTAVAALVPTAQGEMDAIAAAAVVAANSDTTVDFAQAASGTNTVINASGNVVALDTIKTVTATLTVTALQATTMSGVTGGVTLGTVTVGEANAVAGNFSTANTATISDNDMATLATLITDTTTNAYTVTVTDASVDAAALETLNGKTTVDITVTSGTITGTAAQVAAYAVNEEAATGFVNDAAYASTLTAGAVDWTNIALIQAGDGAGAINGAAVTSITNSSATSTIDLTDAAATWNTTTGITSIVGGTGVDTITLPSTQVTSIVGAGGIDIIDLGTTGGAVTVVTGNTAAAADLVTNFVSGEDFIDLSSALTAATLTVGTAIETGDAANAAAGIALVTTAANTDAEVYYLDNNAGAGVLTLTEIETAIAAGSAATGQVTVIVDNGTDTLVYTDQAAETDAGAGAGLILQVTLVGITDGSIATGDFLSV